MNITYIHHSAFFVELPSACLLFDWSEGDLPPIPADKPLYVLASHSHYDHYEETVFDLAQTNPHITFLLSFDVLRSDVPSHLKDRTHFLDPHESWSDGILSLETFRSTDEGVAFWCRVDGKELYHAGDLNHWYWEGEDEQWNRDMTERYRAEMRLLTGRRADAAFLPVDPRLGDWFWLGVGDFLKEADAACIFPMHFWEDHSVCEKLREHPCAASHRDRIQTITRKGQTFTL